MKKTITTLALLAAVPGHAVPEFLPPDSYFQERTICLSTMDSRNGVIEVFSCDESANNADPDLNRLVTASGCTLDQVVMKDERLVSKTHTGKWSVNIPQCISPNVVQL